MLFGGFGKGAKPKNVARNLRNPTSVQENSKRLEEPEKLQTPIMKKQSKSEHNADRLDPTNVMSNQSPSTTGAVPKVVHEIPKQISELPMGVAATQSDLEAEPKPERFSKAFLQKNRSELRGQLDKVTTDMFHTKIKRFDRVQRMKKKILSVQQSEIKTRSGVYGEMVDDFSSSIHMSNLAKGASEAPPPQAAATSDDRPAEPDESGAKSSPVANQPRPRAMELANQPSVRHKLNQLPIGRYSEMVLSMFDEEKNTQIKLEYLFHNIKTVNKDPTVERINLMLMATLQTSKIISKQLETIQEEILRSLGSTPNKPVKQDARASD